MLCKKRDQVTDNQHNLALAFDSSSSLMAPVTKMEVALDKLLNAIFLKI